MMTDEELGRHVRRGWWPLAKSVFEVLDLHDFQVAQIKEKFGYLRIYVDAPQDATPGIKASIHAVLLAAETASGRTCEECGAEGSHVLVRGYWWKTRCEECKDL